MSQLTVMATPNQRDVDGVSVDTDEEVRSKASHLEQSPRVSGQSPGVAEHASGWDAKHQVQGD